MTDPAQNTIDRRELISFRIGDQEFCVDIMSVREIRGWTVATPLPRTPDFVRGVINLRGAVVPVVDLLARFGRASSAVTKRTCVVIVEAACGTEERHVMGLLVDAVNEVLDIAAGDIEPPPAFGARLRSDFIQGVGKVRGKFVLLLDVDRTLSIEEIAGFVEAAAEPASA